MRCAVLLSGGKDSVAATEVAMGHGFDVVGAVCLRPAEDDAWMFHTPNLGVVRGVGQAMGLDLLEMPSRSGKEEEVEDLTAALAAAKSKWSLGAVVSGALASEYQRTRIESACHSLGLRSFMPLWHKDPKAYLAGLLAGGYDIRFARCAAEGVPNEWAGGPMMVEHIVQMEGHRAKPHVAGEGGEYETLVLDAPHYRERLMVDRAHVEQTASRSTWVVDGWHLEAKPTAGPRPAP